MQVLLGVLYHSTGGNAISAKAGVMKERELSKEAQKASFPEFSLVKGLNIAVLSGILSSFFNFGIEAVKPMADAAVAAGFNPLFQNNVTFVVILWGGLTTNLIWTAILSIKNKTYGNFVNRKSPIAMNLMSSALAGTTWFLQFFFYGIGESKLGNGASSWILHPAYVHHYSYCKYVWDIPQGMERGSKENKVDHHCRYYRHPALLFSGGHRELTLG